MIKRVQPLSGTETSAVTSTEALDPSIHQVPQLPDAPPPACPVLLVFASACRQPRRPTHNRPRRRKSSPPSTTSRTAREAKLSLDNPPDPARRERRTYPQARTPRPRPSQQHPVARPICAVVPHHSSWVGRPPAFKGSRWEVTPRPPSTKTCSRTRTHCPSNHALHNSHPARPKLPRTRTSGRRRTGRS